MSSTPANELPEASLPDGAAYEFNSDVASKFEDVISTQIPGYETMRSLTSEFAAQHLSSNLPSYDTWKSPSYSILDIGSSTGLSSRDVLMACEKSLENRSSREKVRIDLLGIDPSEPMNHHFSENMDELKRSFNKVSLSPSVITGDVKERGWRSQERIIEDESVDLVLMTLVLQFIPVEYRPGVLREIFESLKPGGIMVLVEKILPSSVEIGELFRGVHEQNKKDHGFDEKMIRDKARSIEFTLFALTEEMNRQLIEGAGFQKANIECFWRAVNFAGFICVKR